jgi:hypothetical protein
MSGDSRSFSRERERVAEAKYSQHFFRRVPIVTQSYEPDAHDLVPAPKKIGSLDVAMADAASVHVHAKKEPAVTYEPTVRPTIQFRGRLAIADVEDEVAADEVADGVGEAGGVDDRVPKVAVIDTDPNETNEVSKNVAVAPKDSEPKPEAPPRSHGHEVPIIHKKGRGPLHAYTETQLKHLEPLTNPDGIIGEQRARIVNRNPRNPTLVVSAPITDSRIASPFVIAVVGVCGLAVAFFIVGVHSTVVADADSLAEVYTFTFAHIVELVRTHITALLVHSFGW